MHGHWTFTVLYLVRNTIQFTLKHSVISYEKYSNISVAKQSKNFFKTLKVLLTKRIIHCYRIFGSKKLQKYYKSFKELTLRAFRVYAQILHLVSLHQIIIGEVRGWRKIENSLKMSRVEFLGLKQELSFFYCLHYNITGGPFADLREQRTPDGDAVLVN